MLSPNKRATDDGGTGLRFQIDHLWPAAPDPDR